MPISVPSVDKFLFCINLELGAQILGWLGLIGAAIGFMASSFAFGVVVIKYDSFVNSTSIEQKEILEEIKYPITLFLLIAVFYCVFSFYACVQLIRGVKNRSSRQVRPYLILIGIETVFSFLYFLNFTWSATLQGVLGAVINGYLFICIHSLWETFKDEAMRGHNRQYREAVTLEKI